MSKERKRQNDQNFYVEYDVLKAVINENFCLGRDAV
jgi:hypothetical protein